MPIKLELSFETASELLQHLHQLVADTNAFNVTYKEWTPLETDDADAPAGETDAPGGETDAPAGETEEQRKKRKRRTKAEMEAARAAEAALPSEPELPFTPSLDVLPHVEDVPGVSDSECADEISDEIVGDTPAPASFDTEYLGWKGINPGKSERDFLREILQRLVAKVGMVESNTFMQEHGFIRLSELKPADWERFFAEVTAKVGEV